MAGVALTGPDHELARLGVVIASRNRPELCARAVERVLATDVEAVVVVDDRSEPALAPALAALGDERLRVVRATGRGASAARNQGAALVGTELIAFIDDDVTVDQAWVAGIRAAAQRWPDVAAIAGPVRPDALVTPAQWRFEQRVSWSHEREALLLSLADPPHVPYFPFVPHLYGTGANFTVRASEFATVGGFDPCFGPGTAACAAEDIDLAVRLIRSGRVIGFDPAVLAHHTHRTTEAAVRQQLHAYGRGLGAWATSLALAPGRLTVARTAWRGLTTRAHRAKRGPRWWPGQVAEWAGVVCGPVAYGVSRFQMKRYRRVSSWENTSSQRPDATAAASS